jgi:hypothetical protein
LLSSFSEDSLIGTVKLYFSVWLHCRTQTRIVEEEWLGPNILRLECLLPNFASCFLFFMTLLQDFINIDSISFAREWSQSDLKGVGREAPNV